MSKIPKLTKEAISEAYNKILRSDYKKLNNEEMKRHLKRFNNEFKKRQPELFRFITKICKGHMEVRNSIILTPELILYMMVVIDSLYIQEEIDDVGDIFNQGEK